MTPARHPAPQPFDPALTNGRWARILRVCAQRPLTLGDIKRAVRREGEDRLSNKHRTHKAVTRLTAAHLLTRTATGFIATTAGLGALASCAAHEATAAAAADGPSDQSDQRERTAA